MFGVAVLRLSANAPSRTEVSPSAEHFPFVQHSSPKGPEPVDPANVRMYITPRPPVIYLIIAPRDPQDSLMLLLDAPDFTCNVLRFDLQILARECRSVTRHPWLRRHNACKKACLAWLDALAKVHRTLGRSATSQRWSNGIPHQQYVTQDGYLTFPIWPLSNRLQPQTQLILPDANLVEFYQLKSPSIHLAQH
ncbi:hypothetical protein P154DRAFT_229026 [Amniculicola lignicola CBS 123094]|uniref:Uncharacterized protein n=1 Tax=Amniculicola lignicola CBS 123094 TaxID=1392246 RepID=A0A6A5WNW8_9PLEO|nr:hypothetical protein P154DRAFT_229026 [Amniculicola lignicola CBS 123094]